MGTPYAGDPTVFPVSATAPDDGDPDDASHLNPTGEVALDRGAFLARRCLPDGVTSFAAACATPSALPTNVPTPVDRETRVVRGYGTYIFITGAAHPLDAIDVIAGAGGQWLRLDYLVNQPRLVKTATATSALGVPSTIAGLTHNTPDPAGRVGGTPGVLLCSVGNFTIQAGDIFVIDYACPVGIPNTIVAVTESDVCAGVQLRDSVTTGYSIPAAMAGLIETQYNAALNTGGFTLRGAANIGALDCLRRSAVVVLPAAMTNPQAFGLTVAENTFVHAFALCESVLSVSQYRVTQ